MKIPLNSTGGHAPTVTSQIKAAAVELEATFLAEMLKSAGLGKTSQSFGGGAGEDQFASFLTQHQARQLARAGGVGLSEVLITSMMEKTDAE